MKFAVISDIHGNLPALNAVIDDAEKYHIDSFIFAGDYCLSNPFPNECIGRIRNINNKYIIRGNEEKYLENLIGKNQNTWVDGQMQISYWVYKNVSTDNLNYLLSQPTRMKVTYNNISINISHSSADFISDCEHKEWSTSKVAERYGERFITPESFQKDIHSYLDNNKHFQEIFEALDDGVYIFGHSHIQWNYKSDDGKKILINPGSCGLPLDCIEAGVPYTILDISDSGKIFVEARRVPFNKDEYIISLLESEQFKNATVWTKIIAKELKTVREHLSFFLKYADEYATEIGDTQRPFSISTWEKAFDLCKEKYMI